MLRPRFVGSFPTAGIPLHPPLPEVALIGRSNVGKSSLLNAIVGERIARVSATPGKTRALNVYELSSLPRGYYLLDLPGYGYARAGKQERVGFRHLLERALARPRIAGVIWLLDIRRDPSPDDRVLQDVLAAAGTRVLATLTKADKLPRGKRREHELRRALGLDVDQLVVTSARTGEGILELREAIADLVKAGAA